jgi:RecG-like helicase
MEEIESVVEGENPFKQFGYSPPEPVRKVGERWTDARGKMWEQKEGGKVSVNEQAESIRELTRQRCSHCNMDMRWGNRLDSRFFRKSGMCYDCTIKHDTELMVTGKWKDYERKKTMSYQLSFLKDIRSYVQETIDYLNTSDGTLEFADGMGGVEKWSGMPIDDLMNGAKDDYEKLTRDIKELEQMIAEIDNPKEVNGK